MDMGELIAEIRKRECLWNRKRIPYNEEGNSICDEVWKKVASACNISLRKSHYKWDKVDVLVSREQHYKIREEKWDEVAKACNISKEQAKTKWRSLRDKFYRLMKNIPVYTSGETYYIEESEKPKWPQFNNLLFLLVTIKPQYKVIDINDESVIDISSISDTESTSIGRNTPQEAPIITNVSAAVNTSTNIKRNNTPEQNINTNVGVVTIKKEAELLKKPPCPAPFVNDPHPVELVRIPCTVTRIPLVNEPPPLVMIQPQVNNSALRGAKRVYTLDKTDDSNLTAEQYKCPSKKPAFESDVNSSFSTVTDTCANDNENLSFFRSILPLMNKLNTVKQLELRLKLQEIILEELGD